MKALPIEEVEEFSNRMRSALKLVGIHFTSDLKRINVRDLSFIRGIGPKGRYIILSYCTRNGIKLNNHQGLEGKIHPYLGTVYLYIKP